MTFAFYPPFIHDISIKASIYRMIFPWKLPFMDDFSKTFATGNRWAGGSGGSDTAGLGGRGGPYRLWDGNPAARQTIDGCGVFFLFFPARVIGAEIGSSWISWRTICDDISDRRHCDSGEVHSVSEEAKAEVSEEAKAKARAMALQAPLNWQMAKESESKTERIHWSDYYWLLVWIGYNII